MTRRGSRSANKRARNVLRAHATDQTRWSARIRWEVAHGAMRGLMVCDCHGCGSRRDLREQYNPRHPESFLAATAILHGRASYEPCAHCGSTAIRVLSEAEHEQELLAAIAHDLPSMMPDRVEKFLREAKIALGEIDSPDNPWRLVNSSGLTDLIFG